MPGDIMKASLMLESAPRLVLERNQRAVQKPRKIRQNVANRCLMQCKNVTVVGVLTVQAGKPPASRACPLHLNQGGGDAHGNQRSWICVDGS